MGQKVATAWGWKETAVPTLFIPREQEWRRISSVHEQSKRMNRSKCGATHLLSWCLVESAGGPDHDAGLGLGW